MRPAPAAHRSARCLALAALLLASACDGGLPAAQRPVPAALPGPQREAWRRLPFDGAANLRDLGGYRTADGQRVRWGVLYRSDMLGDLSDEDVAYLGRLGLRRVVDFRSPAERERDPDRLPPGTAVELLPIHGEGLDPAALRDRILSGETTAEELARLLTVGNRAFVNEFAPVYAAFLQRLGDAETLPLLFHCTAGKDRAGFAAALTLLALGVPRDAVMRDYLLTNDYTAEKTRQVLRILRLASFFRAEPDTVRPLFEARRSYLAAAFDEIDTRYGGVDAYLERGLGVDAALRARLQANLLE